MPRRRRLGRRDNDYRRVRRNPRDARRRRIGMAERRRRDAHGRRQLRGRAVVIVARVQPAGPVAPVHRAAAHRGAARRDRARPRLRADGDVEERNDQQQQERCCRRESPVRHGQERIHNRRATMTPMSSFREPSNAKSSTRRSGKFTTRDSRDERAVDVKTTRVILFPTEPSKVGRKRIKDAVERASSKK